MKIFKFVIIFLFTISLYAQVTTIPQFPSENDEITVIFDATKAQNDDLVGYTGDLYTHTGVLCTKDGNWQYVIGSWGVNSTQPKLTRIGQDLYELVIGFPREFYDVDADCEILQLNFVFRSADASTQSEDIFVELYNSDLNVKIVEPVKKRSMYIIGDQLYIKAVASGSETLSLFQNDKEIATTELDSIDYLITFSDEGGGYFVAVATDSFEKSVKDSIYYYVRDENEIAELPGGLEYGINYTSNSSATLVLLAPYKESVFAAGDFNNWELQPPYQMKLTPDSSTWWIEINNLTPKTEYAFQYFVDDNLAIADPYTEKVLDPWNDEYIDEVTYPNLKEYPHSKTTGIVSILQTDQNPYQWKNSSYTRPKKENLIVYELLIRDFVNTHNYQTLIDTLDYIKRLGVNAIELMPVNEFEGNSSWGYNPSFYFAPDKYYGTKNKLKEFIDECHGRGIAVIMDIVLNHAYGQSPFVQLYLDKYENDEIISLTESPWFNVKSPNQSYKWGADFNHESLHTQKLIDRINKHWLEEYKFDGFRFDFTKGFTNKSGDGWAYDQSRINILKRMANKIWEIDPNNYVILEHLTANTEEKDLANYGMLLWGNMNHSYNEATMGYNENGKSDFSGIDYQNRGWSAPHLIGYMESHDEERLMFKNLEHGNSSGNYKIKDLNVALQRVKLASAFFYTIPGPKMLWMFGELGYDVSIDDPCRVCEKPILWEYLASVTRNNLYKTKQALIELKNNFEVFNTDDYSMNLSGPTKRINLNHETMNVTIIGNFDVIARDIAPSFQSTGKWYDFFTGDSIIVEDPIAYINLSPGEFHIYSTKKLPTPEDDIISEIKGYHETDITDYKLLQNYPNPFNPETVINYQLAVNSNVSLKVYDMLGREVAILVNENQPQGIYNISFNASDLTSGVYVYRLKAGNYVSSKKMILLK